MCDCVEACVSRRMRHAGSHMKYVPCLWCWQAELGRREARGRGWKQQRQRQLGPGVGGGIECEYEQRRLLWGCFRPGFVSSC
jgi:hypothetical protein